jgi:hypothetical protein
MKRWAIFEGPCGLSLDVSCVAISDSIALAFSIHKINGLQKHLIQSCSERSIVGNRNVGLSENLGMRSKVCSLRAALR